VSGVGWKMGCQAADFVATCGGWHREAAGQRRKMWSAT